MTGEKQTQTETQAKTTQTKTAGNRQKKAETPTGKATAVTALQPVQDAVESGREQMESAFKASNDAVAKQYDSVVNIARRHMDQTSDCMLQGCSEVSGFTKSQVDAMVAATTNVSDGMERLSREMVQFTRQQFDHNVAATRRVFGVTTMTDLFDVQAQIARESVDHMMNQGTRLTEMSMKMVNDALQPLQSQARTNMNKVATFRPAA